MQSEVSRDDQWQEADGLQGRDNTDVRHSSLIGEWARLHAELFACVTWPSLHLGARSHESHDGRLAFVALVKNLLG